MKTLLIILISSSFLFGTFGARRGKRPADFECVNPANLVTADNNEKDSQEKNKNFKGLLNLQRSKL